MAKPEKAAMDIQLIQRNKKLLNSLILFHQVITVCFYKVQYYRVHHQTAHYQHFVSFWGDLRLPRVTSRIIERNTPLSQGTAEE